MTLSISSLKNIVFKTKNYTNYLKIGDFHQNNELKRACVFLKFKLS